MKYFFSIIVPTISINDHILKEIIPALQKQSFKSFELIIIPSKPKQTTNFPSWVKILCSGTKTGPADKRDLAFKHAKGNILAFIDDDAYPGRNWLKNGLKHFQGPKVAAVCGPGITPATDNLKQQVSGWFWQSALGAGAAGTYRCRPEKKRLVDDYPSFNLIVRKNDFIKVGGFDSHFWPGEDTKLCHDLVYKLGKIIVYDPKILVYHHRRPIFIPHLKQISRYGLHRGYFVKILPATSLRIGYFLPSLFVLWFTGFPLLIYFQLLSSTFIYPYLLSLLTYFFLLIFTIIQIYFKEKKIILSLLGIPTIILSHLVYGIYFIKGLLIRNLKQ